MPRYLYTVTAQAQIRETWAIDSDKPLTEAEVMATMTDSDEPSPHQLEFVSDEVVGGEKDRRFGRFVGEDPGADVCPHCGKPDGKVVLRGSADASCQFCGQLWEQADGHV